jgi:hypothetical protein
VTGDALGHAELDPAASISARRLELVARLASGGAIERASELDELIGALFPPQLIAVLERAEALTLVGLDELGPFPIEALPLPPELEREGARTFGECFAVDHWPSLPVGVALCRAADERSAAQVKATRLGLFMPAGRRPKSGSASPSP